MSALDDASGVTLLSLRTRMVWVIAGVGVDLNGALRAILGFFDIFYGRPWVAPFVILPLMLGWAAYIHMQAVRRTRPYLGSCDTRIRAVEAALGSDADAASERDAFSRNYEEVCAALGDKAPGSGPLVQAWREFCESIIDETTSPIRNTTRPSAFFARAAPRQTLLVFWSNIFVGIGLILTFVGLIVALNKAASGMQGGSVQAAQVALVGLLTVSAAKFFTSVAGLLASIWLRKVEHDLSRKVNDRTEALCALLERGLLYVPPQKLAVEQLEVMRQQAKELREFNTDLAFQMADRLSAAVGERFQQALQPVTGSLSTLNDSMTSMSHGLREGLGQGAAEAVSAAANGELRALGQTLNTLGSKLEGLSGQVGASGDEASRQIRVAAELFSEASERMQAAFGDLAGQVDALGGKLTEQGEEAARAQADALGRALSGFDAAQLRGAEVMTGAVGALQSAGEAAARRLQDDLGAALKQGVQEAGATFRSAAEEAQAAFGRTVEASGEGLRSASADLSRAVGEAAGQVERAGGAFERSAGAAVRSAEAMEGIVGHSRTVSAAFSDAVGGMTAAAVPVAQAASALNDAAGRVARSVEDGRAATSATLEKLSELSDGIADTQGAAEEAWRDYRLRFEGVDKSLEGAVVKLGETLGDSLGRFSEFARKFDSEVAGAVSKLGGSLSRIEDYAETLDDYVEETRARRLEPAE